MIPAEQAQIISRCQSSIKFFLRNFGKLKHPKAGILPFNPFNYQSKALKAFRNNRFVIFRKCRQCFRGDQQVWGPHGSRPISALRPGDLVYSLNQATGRLEAVPVQAVYDNGMREVCEVRTATRQSV